jgi:hypothetical protein
MEVYQIIDNWFGNTFEQVKENVRPASQLDLFIAGVLFCARKYSKAILVLLNDGHKLPAEALLRVLCELYAKFFWCLNVRADTRIERIRKIHERFRRWDYSRLIQHRKILKNVQSACSGDFRLEIDKAMQEIEKGIETYNRQKLKCMPHTATIFKELPKDWESEVYPKIYQRFNSAIHLDMKIIRELVKYTEKEKKIICFDDIQGNVQKLLSYCASMACDINRLIRSHYGWDSEQIKIEYESLSCKMQGKK